MIYINYLKDLYAYFKGFVQIIETIYRKGTEDWLHGMEETLQRDYTKSRAAPIGYRPLKLSFRRKKVCIGSRNIWIKIAR